MKLCVGHVVCTLCTDAAYLVAWLQRRTREVLRRGRKAYLQTVSQPSLHAKTRLCYLYSGLSWDAFWNAAVAGLHVCLALASGVDSQLRGALQSTAAYPKGLHSQCPRMPFVMHFQIGRKPVASYILLALFFQPLKVRPIHPYSCIWPSSERPEGHSYAEEQIVCSKRIFVHVSESWNMNGLLRNLSGYARCVKLGTRHAQAYVLTAFADKPCCLRMCLRMVRSDMSISPLEMIDIGEAWG